MADLGTMEVTTLDLDGLSLFPSWSPDGSTIAFASNLDISNPPVLFLINSDGTAARRIPLPLPRTQLNWPDWNPTGDRIVAARGGTDRRLLVTDTLTQDTFWITSQGVHVDDPSWSPDGDWIAYTHRRSSNRFDVRLVRPDGTEDHRLVSNGFDPAWSPDAQRIAFSRRSDDKVAVWSIGVDEDDLTQLTDPE